MYEIGSGSRISMEGDDQENAKVDCMKDLDDHLPENILAPPEGNVNHMESEGVTTDDQMDRQLDADIVEEHFARSLRISEPKSYMKPTESSKRDAGIVEEHFARSLRISEPKSYMKSTESSKRKSKFWNEAESSGLQFISNQVSDFPSIPYIETPRRADGRKQEGCLAQYQHNIAQCTESASKSTRRLVPIRQNDPFENSTTSIKRNEQDRNSTIRQVQAQEDMSQIFNRLAASASRATQNQVYLPSDIPSEESRDSSPASPIYYISCDDSVKTQESFAEKCVICELDLYSPFNWELYEYHFYKDEDEFQSAFLLPDVAVLECGHVLHSQCWEFHAPEDQSSEPPCSVCLSSYR